MDLNTVCQRLQAHIDSDPYRTSEHFRPAEEALAQRVPGVPRELIGAYYEKVQSVWPEVPNELTGRDENTLRGWAEASAKRPDILWNAVLLDYWENDPDRLVWAYETLLRLFKAPADPTIPQLPADDSQLVRALRSALPCNPRFRFPTGWAAVLLQEGSAESVEAVKQGLLERISDDLLDWDMDDLLRLVPAPTTAAAAELLRNLRARVAERNRRNGQAEFFQALGLQLPESVSLVATLPAKSGHRFVLTLARDWRRSLLSWSAFLGKQQASYLVNENGVMTNKLKFEPYSLLQLPQLLQDAARQWKTRWTGPWEFEGDTFGVDLAPRLDHFLGT